jgi:hypothetical protein
LQGYRDIAVHEIRKELEKATDSNKYVIEAMITIIDVIVFSIYLIIYLSVYVFFSYLFIYFCRLLFIYLNMCAFMFGSSSLMPSFEERAIRIRYLIESTTRARAIDGKTQLRRTLTFLRQKIKNEQITMRILTIALLFQNSGAKYSEPAADARRDGLFPAECDDTIFELYLGMLRCLFNINICSFIDVELFIFNLIFCYLLIIYLFWCCSALCLSCLT